MLGTYWVSIPSPVNILLNSISNLSSDTFFTSMRYLSWWTTPFSWFLVIFFFFVNMIVEFKMLPELTREPIQLTKKLIPQFLLKAWGRKWIRTTDTIRLNSRNLLDYQLSYSAIIKPHTRFYIAKIHIYFQYQL